MSNHHEDRNEIRTYFKLQEISRWLGITPFELLINLISFLIFSILLTLAIDGNIEFLLTKPSQNGTNEVSIYRSDSFHSSKQPDWFKLFSVLFCADVLNSYFCFISIIRLYLAKSQALHRIFWSINFILLTALFKYLLALKLTGHSLLEYTEVASPLFVLLQLFALRACQIKN